jgi:hypothetical protein
MEVNSSNSPGRVSLRSLKLPVGTKPTQQVSVNVPKLAGTNNCHKRGLLTVVLVVEFALIPFYRLRDG